MRALFGVLVLLTLAASAFAQAQPAYPGTSTTLPAFYSSGVDAGNTGTWDVEGPGVSGNPAGWNVTLNKVINASQPRTLTVTVPANAPLGPYTASYATGYNKAAQSAYGYASSFQVVNPPPTRPASASGPPFSWQGSVAGVNTGNGNKLTTLPITGWSTRGGMGISVVLYHNSQTPYSSPAGPKWQMSYFTYLTAATDGSPAGSLTLHWDNGLTYTFKSTGGTLYTAPYGILDTLTNSSGTYTLMTPGQTKYTFVTLPNTGGNAYLSAIADLDGNTITIGHNANTNVSRVSDGAGRAAAFVYDGSGRLTSLSDPLGRIWSFNYTGAGDLWFVVDPTVGNSFSFRAFGYDGNHDITTVQDHNNNHATFTYDGNNSLISATDPMGNLAGFNYTPSTTVITDSNGHTMTQAYVASRLASVTDTLGNAENYYYDYNNILTQKTDKNKQTWTYGSHFSKTAVNGAPASVSTDPLGNSSSVTYDSKNKPLVSTDAVGNTTTDTYSTDGHEDLLTANVAGSPAGFTATSTVGGYANGLPTTFQDPLKNPASTVAYDTNGWGLPVAATDPNGNKTTATYNALGWKTSSTDALGHTTRTTYDAWGRATVLTAADGTQSGITYDPNGSVQRVTDADGYAATPIYAVHCCGSAAGRFSADAYGAGGSGALASSSADTSGVAYPAPAAVYTTARIGTFTYTFPNLTPGRNVTVRLHFVESGYNAAGLRQFNVTANGSRVLTNYDVWAAAGGINRANVYDITYGPDANGNLALAFTPGAAGTPVCSGIEILPYGHTVTNLYDADNRLVWTLNGHSDATTYAYDGPSGRGSADVNGQTQYGLLSKKTDGNGHATAYTYTARSEPYQTFYADGTSESIGTTATNGYDANGNVLTRVKGDGSLITYAYDADNRLTGITYSQAYTPNVGFGYDADGRRTSMTDGAGTTTWAYGDGLHLTSLVSPRGTVNYGYDGDGRRANMTGVGVNPSSPYAPYTYGYDPGGRLASLVNPFSETTTFAYYANDLLKQKTLANGAYLAYGYDAADQMRDMNFVASGFGGAYPHHYDYEPNGNLSAAGDGDGSVNYFQYDGADQMLAETRTGLAPFAKSYTYDANGNRLTQTVNGTLAQQFTYDAHDKLVTGIGETDSYDLNGNLRYQTLGGQTTTFGWDGEDRLKSEFFPASQAFPSGHEDLFTYTGLGMRLTKHDPTGTYSYLADGVSPASPVLSDGLTASFTPGISQTSGNGAGGYTSRFYMADAQGNSRAMTDGGQALTDTYTYDAFGSAQSHAGGSATAYGWGEESGYQTDQDGGLRLLGHRYYDSRTGRFISQDPAGDGDNWYTYCGNSPTNGSDPSGLVEQLVGTLNLPGGWSEDNIFSFLSNSYNPGTYQVSGGQAGTYTITIPGDPNPGMGAPGGGFMAGQGNVGDSRGLPEIQRQINLAIDKLNKGGISKDERQSTNNALQKLQQAKKATEKGLGQRGSRANKEAKTPRLSDAERAAKDAARAQRDKGFELERAQLEADGAVATAELEAAETAIIIDEIVIGVGVVVK